MRNQLATVLLLLGGALGGASGVQAACPPEALRPLVLPGAHVAYLSKSDLGLSQVFGNVQWTAPLHGVVTDLGDRLAFAPDRSFWDIGVDSILISTPGRTELPKTVQWVAATRPEVISVEDFEDPENPNWDFGTFDPDAISPLGKLSGNYGLRFTSTPYGGSTSVTSAGEETINGATAGGGAVASWRPPGGGGIHGGTCGEQGCPEGVWYLFLQARGNSDGLGDHSVFVKEFEQVVLIGLSTETTLPQGTEPTAIASVTREPHLLELVHWPSADGRGTGAALWIDGIQELAIETPVSFAPASFARTSTISSTTFTFHEVPATPSPLAPDLFHSFDDLAVFQVPAEARFHCDVVDGFDGGVIDSAWTLYNAANLTPLSAAGLVGKIGLDVNLTNQGGNVGGQLQLVGVVPSDRRGLRFRFDPNEVDLGSGMSLNLALGIQTPAVPRPFATMLKRIASGLALQVQTRDDLGGAKSTTVAIADAPHVLELDWQRSKTAHVGTGYLRVWLDGVLVAKHLGLDNDGQSISEVRIGAVGALGAAKGHIYLDQIEVWNEALPGH